jgi:hypothetical protein
MNAGRVVVVIGLTDLSMKLQITKFQKYGPIKTNSLLFQKKKNKKMSSSFIKHYFINMWYQENEQQSNGKLRTYVTL